MRIRQQVARLHQPATASPKSPPQCTGFALVITIALLAFLVVLLVGLATYTRIETAAAGNTQRLAQARQNALFALDVALGQLQKHAGPDERVTATGAVMCEDNPNYTGVWSTTKEASAEPDVWLVSGSEAAVDQSLPPIQLVGPQTVGRANRTVYVTAPVVALRVHGVPGQGEARGPTAGTTIGHYAWWVGDQGVKAPVAAADSSPNVSYGPWVSSELNSRIWQQIPLGAGAAELNGQPVFERCGAPDLAGNTGLSRGLIAFNQVAFLAKPDGSVGLASVQQYFHAWTTNNFNVLASTVPNASGLRRDLSLKPDLLGRAFSAWADYDGAGGHSAHMENPAAPCTPGLLPAYGSDPLRRRHRLAPPDSDRQIIHSIAPLLSLMMLQFNVRRAGPASTTDLQVRAKMVAGLWNPYSSALVPEDCTLEISGLPTLTVTDSNGGVSSIDLQALFGPGKSGMEVLLKFTDNTKTDDPDHRSWLPGRVYFWRTKGGSMGAWQTEFYNLSLANIANNNIWVAPANASHALPAGNTVKLGISAPPATLTVRLYRTSDHALLATYTTPPFSGFNLASRAVNENACQFGYPFRLIESIDTVADPANPCAWLTSVSRDPRSPHPPAESYRPLANGLDPALYGGDGSGQPIPSTTWRIRAEDRLLDRAMGTSGMSYNEDTPIFELPRAPVLSLGMLQHLQIADARSFSIGNSWGARTLVDGRPANALFDQFFFSGLAAGVTAPDLAAGQGLPNPLFLPLARKPDGTALAPTDLAAEAATGLCAKYLLQGGSFNLNSVNPAAWLAVLRSVRPRSAEQFTFLDASCRSGTAEDFPRDMVPRLSPDPPKAQATDPLVGEAVFFRFSQSAQETYKAFPGYAASNADPGMSQPPNQPSAANTHLFRQGLRKLAAAETAALARAVVWRVAQKQKATGPFRSLEEFLSPMPLFGGKSLLESAIAGDDPKDPAPEINLNAGVAEFSSQWLTQGDIMTALAPILFPRSDTFIIRAYGDVSNPATGAGEGRAWCEALVQRFPEPFAAADPPRPTDAEYQQPPGAFGRRFKIISFRWLTRFDL
ncbi:MAG: hypothetical protein PHQ04_08825 [Opitutaceae bacterium]|nr:hypothetical protein [Opitutaceae bacterium]